MKIILLEDIKALGKKGEVKDVSEGYARNFLLPKKMAKIATSEAVEEITAQKEKERAEEAKNTEKMRQLASILKEKEIVIKSKEKKGKLFGSISAKNIAEKLKESGTEISQEKIILKNAIKKTGEYRIEINLTPGISASIKLKVEGD